MVPVDGVDFFAGGTERIPIRCGKFRDLGLKMPRQNQLKKPQRDQNPITTDHDRLIRYQTRVVKNSCAVRPAYPG
jgi:hypothetical protein